MSQYLANKSSNVFFLASCLAVMLLAVACKNGETKPETKPSDTTMAVSPDTVVHFTIAMVDNKKDPSCGMPVTAGIGDTAHYKDKTIGFCSAECKAEFKKNPDASIAAADLKK